MDRQYKVGDTDSDHSNLLIPKIVQQMYINNSIKLTILKYSICLLNLEQQLKKLTPQTFKFTYSTRKLIQNVHKIYKKNFKT